jgi:hypothetical protein
LQGPYIQEINTPEFPLIDSLRGGEPQAWFSSDGTVYARYDVISDIEVYDFDRCTGLLTPRERFWPVQGVWNPSIPIGVANLALSASGRYLYTYTGDSLTQYDLYATPIKSSETVVDSVVDSLAYQPGHKQGYWGYLHLGPDGRIYSASYGFVYDSLGIPSPVYCHINAILAPDSAGKACHPVQRYWEEQFPFYDGIAWLPVVPNHPNYRLGALPGTACDSLGLPAWYAGPIERVDTTVGVAPPPSTGSGSGIRVWPNPASSTGSGTGGVTVELPTQTIGTLQLISATGVVLNTLPFSGQQVEVPLTGVPAGVYMVRVHTRKGAMHTAKLVVLP